MEKCLNVTMISNYGKLKHNNILAVDIFQILPKYICKCCISLKSSTHRKQICNDKSMAIEFG